MTEHQKNRRCEECDEFIENQDPVYCAPDYNLVVEHLRKVEEELVEAVVALRDLHNWAMQAFAYPAEHGMTVKTARQLLVRTEKWRNK